MASWPNSFHALNEPGVAVRVRESVIARSPSGNPVLCFENETLAKEYLNRKPYHSLTLFKQIITEERISS